MRICSFDIGIKNFSVCIEDYDIDKTSQSPLPIPKQKYKKGTLEATDEMKEFVSSIAALGKIIFLQRKELGERKHYFSGAAYHNLYNWVDELHPYLQTTDVILIEQQMRVNNVALSLMSHLHAYLLIKYCRHSYFEFMKGKSSSSSNSSLYVQCLESVESKTTLDLSEPETNIKPKKGRKKKLTTVDTHKTEITQTTHNAENATNPQNNPYSPYPCSVKLYPSKNKTRILGAALKEEDTDGKLKKVSKYNLKKWSVMEVDKILKQRKDEAWHNYIFKENKSKQDDLSDVIVQSLSYVVNKYL